MTRAEALKLNKRYQLSGEVKKILKSEGFHCHIYVPYTEEDKSPMKYVIYISGLYDIIDFWEFREYGSSFDPFVRGILRRFGHTEL